MTSGAGRVAVVALILIALVGCTSDGSSEEAAETLVSDAATPSEQAAPESPPTPPDEDPATSTPAVPELGDCWDVPPDKAFSRGYWHDASPRVSCSASHTTETVSVYPLERPTREKAELLAAGCHSDALRHLGVDTQHWLPWALVMYLPSREQVEAGASWLRCDVAFPADYPGTRPRRHTNASVEAAATGDNALWGCLDLDPRRPADQPLVPCSEPHRYESTGTLVTLEGLTAYPTRQALSRAARQCRDDLPASQRDADVRVTARWDPEAWFDPVRGEVYGGCWFGRADGEMLAPRR